MPKKLFGTDGIRGRAGQPPLDDRTVFAAGLALAQTIPPGRRHEVLIGPEVLIGMDTRESGLELAELLAGGLDQGGVAVKFAGVMPTAGVAYLTEKDDFVRGVMISASHNAFSDNGIKVFGPSGYKLPDEEEERVETAIFGALSQNCRPRRSALEADESLVRKYLDHLASVGDPAAGFETQLVVDCANGAASDLAADLFKRLGVRAEIIADQPNGRNINLDCGSLYMEALQQRVTESGADLGVAFDGDADRALFVDEKGNLINGDVVLLLAGRHLADRDRLPGRLVVTTVMANMGLEKALAKLGIRMSRTKVGDKYVLEEMLRSGAALGGEQSGHIIFGDLASTGDGLLTARMMLEILAASGKPMSELASELSVFPQVLKNIRVKERAPFDEVPALRDAVSAAENDLGDRGRVLVRYSGTEPLVRIMVEAEEEGLVERQVSLLAEVFQRELGE